MKEFVDIHDYLVSEQVVGDWDGDEEAVVERINELYHTLYQMAEDDIETDELIQLLELIWENWIGQDVLPELESEEIIDWCHHVLINRDQFLTEQ
jgi:hypothetical protein